MAEVDDDEVIADSGKLWAITPDSEGGSIDKVLVNGPSSFFKISYLICFALSIVFASTRAQDETSGISASMVVKLESTG
jgi:hypothetical protein